MPLPQKGTTQNHSKLGLSDKCHAIKGLVVCNSWYVIALFQLNDATVRFYVPPPEDESHNGMRNQMYIFTSMKESKRTIFKRQNIYILTPTLKHR